MDQKYVGDSPFTWKFLIDALEAHDDEYRKVYATSTPVEIKAVDISAGEGFLSKIYHTRISFDDSTSYEVVLKVPGIESVHQVFDNIANDGTEKHDTSTINTDSFVVDVHNRECDFYNLIGQKCGAPLLKTYLSQRITKGGPPGCILMESAIGKARAGTFSEGLTKEVIFDIAKALAHMAAYSLMNPLEGKYPFELYDHGNVAPMVPPMLKKLREFNEEWFGVGVERLQKYLVSEPFLKYVVVGHYKDVGLPGVLVHGDLWSNNILFDDAKNVNAFIDWQLIHEGSMTFDLSRILVVCTDAELRRECTEEAFQLYYETLKNLMEGEGKRLEFDFKTMMQEARVTMFSQMGDLLSMVPFCCSHMDKDDPRIQTVLVRAKAALDDIGGYIEEIGRRDEFLQ
ncbi:hypothetical protein QR680_013840 [Steinernema hermaphroditum]|uniref:CHK kinase-like domain-containing protein n=1 Tax=Steinernema hermaphroditum TaxID=289476 RepID=A0AA39I8F9_9BILA|nr:hypothetical protein QR680_013840 [Steinernema hermaphroditum]